MEKNGVRSPQLNKMSTWYRVMYCCKCCISSKSMHSYLLSWRDNYPKHLKHQIHNDHSRSSGKMDSHIFETYKNSVMLNGHHIDQTSSGMDMNTMCVYPFSQHVVPHWKCVLICCEIFPHIYIPSQEPDKNHSNKCPKIFFMYITWPHSVQFMVDFIHLN